MLRLVCRPVHEQMPSQIKACVRMCVCVCVGWGGGNGGCVCVKPHQGCLAFPEAVFGFGHILLNTARQQGLLLGVLWGWQGQAQLSSWGSLALP